MPICSCRPRRLRPWCWSRDPSTPSRPVGGALRLDPGELPAGVDAVLIEADADEIGRGLQAAGGAVRIGERGRGDVAEALALRISEHYHERAAVLEYDGERPRAEAEAEAEAEALAAAWRPFH